MKLQKRLNRRVDSKEYSKWIVVLPDTLVTELGWKEGVELKGEVDTKNDKLFLSRLKKL